MVGEFKSEEDCFNANVDPPPDVDDDDEGEGFDLLDCCAGVSGERVLRPDAAAAAAVVVVDW